MSNTPSERAQAEAKLAEIQASVERVKAAIVEHEAIALEARVATEREADRREDLLARGADAAAVEEARLAAASAAGRCNEAGARARGGHRLLDELEQQLPDVAVEVVAAHLTELDADVRDAREKLTTSPSEASVARFSDLYLRQYSCAHTLFNATANLAHRPGSWDLRAILEHMALLPLAEEHVKHRGVARPKIVEPWRVHEPLLLVFKERREATARRVGAEAAARREEAQRASRASDPFGFGGAA